MKNIMDSYQKLAQFLALMLGPNYEIVIHDATKDNVPIIAIENGYITGRQVGDSASMFTLKTIASKQYLEQDYMSNHDVLSKNNKPLRSSTYFIKDNGKLLGLLCINFDDTQFIDLARKMLELVHPNEIIQGRENQNNQQEDLNENVSDIVYQTIEEYLNNIHLLTSHTNDAQFESIVSQLTPEQRSAIIAMLQERGVFLVKKAVSDVATILQISEPSVYRYLSKLK